MFSEPWNILKNYQRIWKQRYARQARQTVYVDRRFSRAFRIFFFILQENKFMKKKILTSPVFSINFVVRPKKHKRKNENLMSL